MTTPLLDVLTVRPQTGRWKWRNLKVHPGDMVDMDEIHGDGSHRYYVVGDRCDYCEKRFKDRASVVIEVRVAQADSRIFHPECELELGL